MRPPCQIEDSGWFEWGMNANCQAQVPYIVPVGLLVLLIIGLWALWKKC